MNILIACHCKAQHMPVYITDSITNPKAKYYSLYDEKMLPEIKQQFGINKIDYIDKKCNKNTTLSGNQYTKWDDLPLYDAIYLIHCPIYGLFTMKEEYKYIDSLRNIYKDMRNHLKPNGYIYIENDVRPTYVKVGSPGGSFIRDSLIVKGDKIKHIRKVYDDIFQSNSNGNSNSNENGNGKVKYTLDIVEGKKLDKLPFHIGTEKSYPNSSWFAKRRVMILKFPKGTSKNKTSKHSSTPKKTNKTKKTITK